MNELKYVQFNPYEIYQNLKLLRSNKYLFPQSLLRHVNLAL